MKKKKLVVGFLCSGQEYIELCYYSLLSNLVYTDINKFDIKLFIKQDDYELVCNLFIDTGLVKKEDIIILDSSVFKKYYAWKVLYKKYEVVVINDADLFVLSNSFNHNRYAELYKYHTENPYSLLNYGEHFLNKEGLDKKFNRLLFSRDLTEYERNIVISLKNEITGNYKQWLYAAHTSFNSQILNEINPIFWEYMDILLKVGSYDDELLLMVLNLLYQGKVSITKCKDILHHDNFVEKVDFMDFKMNNNFILVHPKMRQFKGEVINYNLKYLKLKIISDYTIWIQNK